MITARPDVRNRIFERDEGICGICNLPVDFSKMHLDHIVPISAGGKDAEDNLQVSHPTCNFSKGGLHDGLRPNQRNIVNRGPLEQLLLRLPKDLWKELKRWAEIEDRSLNSQIVHLLRKAVDEWRSR